MSDVASASSGSDEDENSEPLIRCSVCSKLNYDFFLNRHSFSSILNPTFFSLGSSDRLYHSSEKCPLCRVLYCHLIYQATTRPLLKSMLVAVFDIKLHLTQDDELLIACETEIGRLKLCDIASDVVPLVDADCVGSAIEHRTLNPSVDNDGPMVFSWLTACEKHHEKCNINVSRAELPLLPTRVIDVEATDIDGDACCRLILSEDRHAEYITLSHCWGGVHHNMVLTSENLPTMLASIPDAELPKTFRDAVWITRQLEKRYLWIDSLCIIQPTAGDNSDWAIEGGKMSDIYSNSYLTIAASSASNSFEGCLFGRLGSEFEINPATLFEHPTHREWDNGANYFERDTEWLPMALPNPPSWVNIIQNSPLGSRAWVLQERMLSRRTLYASVQGFFWECADMRASLYEPLGCAFDYMFRDNEIKTVNQLLSEEQPDALLGYHWRRIVEHYTRLHLTVKSDRLPAIAGLAQRLGGHTGGRYLAGHWTSSLLTSLLWFRLEDETGNSVRPSTALAPSWSWAAMPGAIKFTPLDKRDYPTRNIDKDYTVAATVWLDGEAEPVTIIHVTGRLQRLHSWMAWKCLPVWIADCELRIAACAVLRIARYYGLRGIMDCGLRGITDYELRGIVDCADYGMRGIADCAVLRIARYSDCAVLRIARYYGLRGIIDCAVL